MQDRGRLLRWRMIKNCEWLEIIREWFKSAWGNLLREFWDFNSKTNEMHQMSQIYFILEWHSTCFGRSFRPSSGVQDCTYSNRRMSKRYSCVLASKQTAVSVWQGRPRSKIIFDVKIKIRKYKIIQYQVLRISIRSEKISSNFSFLIRSSIFWHHYVYSLSIIHVI